MDYSWPRHHDEERKDCLKQEFKKEVETLKEDIYPGKDKQFMRSGVSKVKIYKRIEA